MEDAGHGHLGWVEGKKRKEGQEGDQVRNKVTKDKSDNRETCSHYTGDTLEMKQETGTCVKDSESD